MAGEQNERRIDVGRVHVGLQDRRFPPPRIDLGPQHDSRLLAAPDPFPQRVARARQNAAHHGAGKLIHRDRGRIAPDRGDAHLVQVLVRADVQLARRTRQRGATRDRGSGDAIHQHNAPGHVETGEIRVAPGPDVHQPSRQSGIP
jgi:hypothetical protein